MTDASQGIVESPRTVGRALFALRIAIALFLLTPALLLALGRLARSDSAAADLLANLSAHLAAASITAGLLALALRRPFVAIVAAGAGALMIVNLGADRAGRADGPPAVRLLHVNAMAANERPEDLLAFVEGSGADVAVVLELPQSISRAVRRDGLASLPHATVGAPNGHFSQWVLLASRWPLEPWGSVDPAERSGVAAATIHTPDGPLGVVALHASSPRTAERWRIGNATVDRAIRVASEMRVAGLPVVMVGDLNGTAGGERSRRIRARAGLSHAKPLWTWGTYPATLPGPLRVAIDDALVSGGVRVATWRTVECPGSDHLAVEIGLGSASSR